MTDLEASMVTQAPEMGLLERASQLGGNILHVAQGFIENGKRIAAPYTAAGAIALGSGAALVVEGFVDNGSASGAEPELIHGTSDLNTQFVLDGIRHIVLPCEPVGGCTKWVIDSNNSNIHPTFAFIYPSSGGFTATCNRENGKFNIWDESPAGTLYKTCITMGGGGVPNILPHTTKNEYQKKMGTLAQAYVKSIKESGTSIKLDEAEAVKSIRGDRNKITAQLKCPSETTTSTANDKTSIKTIVITEAIKDIKSHNKTVQQQYSKVFMTPC